MRVVEEKYLYTEVVYYDDNGREIERVRQYDDTSWDQKTREPTEEEIEDYYS
jgi:hypothetical protein